MTKIIIFGERPGPNTDPARPLFPHTTTGAAARLMKMLGMSQEEYLNETIRYNVVDDHTTPTTAPEVRERMKKRLEKLRCVNEARFIVLGRDAAMALPQNFRYQPFGYAHKDVLIIPHPSGRNRYYNSYANKLFIEQSLREFLGRFQTT